MVKKLKIARVSTVPNSILGSLFHFEYLQNNGCDISIITSPEAGFDKLEGADLHQCIPLLIKRKISIIDDLKSVFNLYRIFKKEKFDLVHSNTPKAALVSCLAGLLARVPVRIHTFTGQRWVTMKGPKRWLMMFFDKMVISLNTACLSDGPSQSAFLKRVLKLSEGEVSTLHRGGFTGVDLKRFHPGLISKEKRAPKISFVGRVVNDKGIVELLDAFILVRKTIKDAELVIIGPYEKEHDPLPNAYEKRLFEQPGVSFIGHHYAPEELVANSDIFCLPSYREGFPAVILEASALKVPTVGSNIYGIVDSIVDGESGVLVPPRDTEALACALIKLLTHDELRLEMGEKAYQRVIDSFTHEILAEHLMDFYRKLLEQNN